MSPLSHPSRQTRWLEWALPLLALAMAAVLVAWQAWAYVSVRRAAEALQRGQAQAALEQLHDHLLTLGRAPTEADLTEYLDAHAADGLRHVAVGRGPHQVSAGTTRLTSDGALRRGVVLGATRVRATGRLRPKGRRGGGMHLEDRGDRHGSSSSGSWPMGRARMAVELEPVLARTVQAEAGRTLALGIASAVLFLALALLVRRVLRQRESLLAQAAQQSRLAALGEMSAVLAHEIRNPLASLKGHAQLLMENLPAGSAEYGKVQRIVGEAVRLEGLTTDLLDFIRSGRLDLRELDLLDVVRDAAEAAGVPGLAIEGGSAPVRMHGDPERLRQVFLNVLRNAKQASEEPVEVGITAQRHEAEVTVRDRGPGVAAGEEELVFEPFHTSRVRGTGLGLAVVRRIVQAHGGQVWMDNHPEGGARVRIVLPFRPPEGAN
jgi:two-component system, NtrC family, sensor histidine kinase HydH